jgi:actin-related protein 8, plant
MNVPPFPLLYAKKICYVAVDYEAELCKDTQASCEVDGEGWFTLSEERFKMAEILFQPQMGRMYVTFSVA